MTILKIKRIGFYRVNYLLEKYRTEIGIFLLLFIINFSTIKFSTGSGSNGNVEQWINLTNEMFYGKQDFLFSYGPLYWITGGAATLYNTFSYWLAVTFISTVTAFFWSVFFTLSRRSNSFFYFAIAYFLFFISLLLPAALYLWPVAVLAYFEFSNKDPVRPTSLSIIFLGILTGLSFYVRFLFGIVALTAFGSYFLSIFLTNRKVRDAATFLFGVGVSYLCLGLIIFHNKSSLINYIVINTQLSFGNSVDMTLNVTNSDLSFVAVGIVVILLNLYLLLQKKSLLLTVNLLLLIFFKLGFSRTDHYIHYFVVPAAALSLLLLFKKSLLGRVLFLGIMASLYYLSSIPSYIGASTENSLRPHTDFHVAYTRRMAAVYPGFKLENSVLKKIGRSSIDIYPYNNEYAFANNLNYKHRPLFQNYMTLTPVLDKMNEHYFESKKRPKFVLWTGGIGCNDSKCDPFDAFDNKFSLNQDPLTTTSILLNYHSVDIFSAKDNLPALLLEANATSTRYSESLISSETIKLNQWYRVPNPGSGVVKIIPSLKFTFLGRVKNALFRGDVLNIKYKLDSGEIRKYRTSILNARSGIWVSPLLDSFKLAGPVVRYIMFETRSRNYLDPTFHAKWVSIPISSIKSEHSVFNEPQVIPESTRRVIRHCDGYIDAVNGKSLTPKIFATDAMRVKGWFAISAKEGTAADKIFITLTDHRGSTTYFSTQSRNRPDVAAAFKQRGLSSSGYESLIDLRALSGSYKLGLAGIKGNELYICSQYATQVTVGH